jgi:predicted ABC-type ATPase
MFAGPNGSGKTTVQRDIAKQFPTDFLGVLVNPDDLEATAANRDQIDIGQLGVSADENEVREAFLSSALLKQHGLDKAAAAIRCDGREIDFAGLPINSYYASVLAEFLRRKLLSASISFSFETVMSDRSKVDLLREARVLGFRTYMYYVATEDPEINVARVALRVSEGGHDVPKEKIISRYYRSLALVREALRHTDRAYFFDTSEPESLLIAESTDGKRPELLCQRIPNWFKTFVWDKMQ